MTPTHRFPLLLAIGAFLLFSTSTVAFAGGTPFSPAVGQICRAHTLAAEQRHQLPKLVLSAISLAESGRWHPGQRASYPWPWTVTSGSKSMYFDDKDSAIAAVRRLQAQGVRNIDVGCMQVNLRYHPDAFDDLSEAFEPAANADYAAGFLRDLFQETRSWDRAIGRYHSATPVRAQGYLLKVKTLWRDERVRNAQLRREAVKAAYRQRQQALRAARAETAAPTDS